MLCGSKIITGCWWSYSYSVILQLCSQLQVEFHQIVTWWSKLDFRFGISILDKIRTRKLNLLEKLMKCENLLYRVIILYFYVELCCSWNPFQLGNQLKRVKLTNSLKNGEELWIIQLLNYSIFQQLYGDFEQMAIK